jgi:hypothetical protein
MSHGTYVLEGVLMDAPDHDGGPKYPLRWDGVVTAGNILSIVAFLGTLIIWSLRLEGRVDAAVKDMDNLQKRVEQGEVRHDRSDANIASSLQRLDDKITRLLLDGGRPPGRTTP